MNRYEGFLMLKDEKLLHSVRPIFLGKWSIFLLDYDCAPKLFSGNYNIALDRADKATNCLAHRIALA